MTFEERRLRCANWCGRSWCPPRRASKKRTASRALVRQLKALGMFGMTTPQQYGGLGLNMSEEVQLVFELTYASPVFRAALGSNNGIGAIGLINEGTPEQKQKYLPRIATGELISSFCLTEQNAGSDVASLETTAVRDGDHFILNGTKRFITNSPRAGLIPSTRALLRRTPAQRGSPRCWWSVPRPASVWPSPGRPWVFAASHSADVIFKDCRVPSDALLGMKEGVGSRPR